MESLLGLESMSIFSTWVNPFIRSRGLATPTGEPLYTYRVTSFEFDDLQATLRAFIKSKPQWCSLNDLMRVDYAFAQAFVIYAAEWWRRRYDGSGWRWEPILQNIGAQPTSWHPSHRSTCVELGLRGWRIELSASRGFRYLGSVAVQGGLPIQALAAARGNIGRVLERVLKLSAASHATEEEAVEWIESLSSWLPAVYRQREIYYLLAQVITTVLVLKQRADLQSPDTAIEQLDAHVPNWRNRFPLPIEDLQARALIEQLVKQSTRKREAVAGSPISVERKLEDIGNGKWQIASSTAIPQYLDEASLAQLFSLGTGPALPRNCTLRFEMGRQQVATSARRLTGQAQYRVERKPIVAMGTDGASEHLVHFVSPDGATRSATVSGGGELAPDMPWVFERSDDGINRFVRQGSGSVRTRMALAAIPTEWSIHSEGIEPVDSLGVIVQQNRNVFEFCGTARIIDPDGAVFRVRSGTISALEEHFQWKGERAWDLTFVSPAIAFRGIPRLKHQLDDGTEHTVTGPVLWKTSGERTTTPSGLSGPAEATWPVRGEIQFRGRLVLLPDDAHLSIGPSPSPSCASLDFRDWALVSASTEDPDIEILANSVGNSLITKFTYTGPGSPPEILNLTLYWRGNTTPARIKLPFPVRGARAFNKDGEPLPQNTEVTADGVFGIRLVAFLAIGDRASLRFTLFDGLAGVDYAFLDVRPAEGSRRVEVRISDHLDRIRRMLSSGDSVDASVRVELHCGDASPAAVRVTRFVCSLDKLTDEPGVTLPDFCYTSTDVEAIRPRMLRLDRPGDEPVLLERCTCTTSPKYAWHVREGEIEPGPWLIYPPPGSPLVYRPMLWTVRAPSTDIRPRLHTDLATAIATEEPSTRRELVNIALDRLARNYDDADWCLVEQLANHLGHLPLTTLDIWSAFTRSPEAMAALALRISAFPANFLDRFAGEMPVIWESIPLRIWVDGMRSRNRQGSAAQVLTSRLLPEQRRYLISLQPSLWVLLELAECIVCGSATPEIRLAMSHAIDFRLKLFGNHLHPQCSYQDLLHDKAEAQWPMSFDEIVSKAVNGPAGQYMLMDAAVFRRTVVNMPVLLGASAARNLEIPWLSDESRIRALRKIQDFSPEWFSDAFDLTVAQCVADGTAEGLEALK